MPTFLRGEVAARPVDDSALGHLDGWLNRRELEIRQQQALAKLLLDVGEEAPNRTFNPGAADERSMRGVPILGKGVGGAIAGSRPEVATERNLDRLLAE